MTCRISGGIAGWGRWSACAPPAGSGGQRHIMTAGLANAPAALIQANVRSLVCADRVEANRHDYADALPAVMDPEGTTAAAARTYRLPTAARHPLVWWR